MLGLRVEPLRKVKIALLVFVAPAKIKCWPVVADASMRLSEEWIVVGVVAVAAMSVIRRACR
jgi:hypothetical protein